MTLLLTPRSQSSQNKPVTGNTACRFLSMCKNIEWPANKFNIIKLNNHNSKAPSPKRKEIEFRCLPNKGLCINNIISISQNYQLLLHQCLPNFHAKRTTPVYLHENNVQKLRPSFPITHFGLMAVIKNNPHTLKSSWVAKQLNNLIKKKKQKSPKTTYLTGHLKGLMGLLARIPTRRGFGQTTRPLESEIETKPLLSSQQVMAFCWRLIWFIIFKFVTIYSQQ